MTVEVEIWTWRLVGGDWQVLSADERRRAARFVFDRDRDRYIAGRSRLRAILGRCLDQPPERVVFSYGAHGRPDVAGLAFNLSHTEDLAALAVLRAPSIEIGLDIEAVRPVGMAVAEAHFARSEMAVLHALPEAERIAAFHRCWTRKEAYLKARGTGLMTDLRSFGVTLAPGDSPHLTFCRSGEAAQWTLHDLDVAPGVAGAFAVRSGGRPVRVLRNAH